MKGVLVLSLFILFFILLIFLLAYGLLDRIIDAKLPSYNSLKVESNVGEHINKSFIHVENSSELYVLIIPSNKHNTLKDDSFKSAVTSRGYSYLRYEFSQDILSLDYNLTKKSFEEIDSSISKDLIELKDKYGFKKINIVGISMGATNALLLSNGNDIVNKVILVLPGDSLAKSLWEGIRTRQLRHGFESNGISLEELDKAWQNLSPENNLDKLKGKEVFVYLSKADRVIPYPRGKQLVKSMESAGITPYVDVNMLWGHYGTLWKFSNNPEKLLNLVK